MPIQDVSAQSRLERMRKRLAGLQDRDDLRVIDPGKIRLERNRRLLESAYSEEDKDRLSRAIKRDTPRGWYESLFTDEYGQDTILPVSLPFIGSGDSAVEIYMAYLADERGTASYEQSQILKDYYDFTVRPVTTMGKAIGVFREVGATGVEFYLSGGLGTLGRKALTETAEKGLKSMLKKVLVSGFRKKSVQTGASSLAKMGRALKEGALAAPGQMVRMELQKEGVRLAASLVGIESEAGGIRADAYMNYIRNRYQLVPVNEYGASVRVIDDSYGMWSSAIPNAVVNNLVEVFSEHTGYAIAHMVPSLKVGLLGKPLAPGGVGENMLAILGLAGDVSGSKMLQRVGLSGLVPEMGEEFVGALIRDVVHAAAPSLADEGNTQHLIDNIVPITLGMGLGIFGTSSGIGAISYVHGHDHYAKTSSDGKKNFRAMVNAATAPGREGTVKAGSRMIDYIHAGIRGEGASELMADASVRVKFFESEGVQREARERVGRKIDINDIGGIEKMSTDEVEAEKHLMWEELNQEYLLIEEESEDGQVEVSSPGIERLIELEVITEEEAPQIIEKIQERIDGFRDADKNKAMVEFWKDLGEERVSIELAKAVEAGVYGREGDTAEPEGLKVAAWMKAGRDIEKLKALYKAGKTEALEEEIARTVYDPRLVESEEVVEDRVKEEEAERRLEELVKGDIDAAIEDVNIALEKKGVDDVIELYEDPSPHEKVKEAIDFGLVVVPVSSTQKNILGFWSRNHKILFYNPQAIESRAKDEGFSVDELYAITIYKELLRAHVTDMNEAAREEWLTAAKGWIDELDVNSKFKKDLVLHEEIYKGELDMAAIESEVTLTLARLSLLGKDFSPPGREPGLIGWLRSFASSLLEFAIPGAMGSSKRVTAVRAALEDAGVNTEDMSPSQIMMAYASSVHVFDVVGMLSPARDTVEKILKSGDDDFTDVLVDEDPGEDRSQEPQMTKEDLEDIGEEAARYWIQRTTTHQLESELPQGPSPEATREYLKSLSRKAVIDLAKDLREEGIGVKNVSGSKDQIIDSILKAILLEDSAPPDSSAFMALEKDFLEEPSDIDIIDTRFALQEMSDEWFTSLGLKTPDIKIAPALGVEGGVRTLAQARWYRYSGESAHRYEIQLSMEVARDLAGGGLRGKLETARAMEVLAHEMGHILDYQYLKEELPKEENRELELAYNDWLSKIAPDLWESKYSSEELGKAKASKEAYALSARTRESGWDPHRYRYVISKPEWVADQVSIYLMNGKRGLNLSEHVARIIAKIGELVRRAYKRLFAINKIAPPEAAPIIARIIERRYDEMNTRLEEMDSSAFMALEGEGGEPARRSYPRLTADVKFGAAAEEGAPLDIQEQFHMGGGLPKAEDFGEGGEIVDPDTGAVWKVKDGEWARVDDALYAPPSMLVPFSAAVVGDLVLVSDGSVPDYLGEVIEIGEEKTYLSSSTGMLEEGKVSIRPIDETDLVAPNTLLAPWQGPVSPTGQSKRIETSPRNLYHPDLSWYLVEENGEYYWVQAKSRKRLLVKPRGQTVDREDAEGPLKMPPQERLRLERRLARVEAQLAEMRSETVEEEPLRMSPREKLRLKRQLDRVEEQLAEEVENIAAGLIQETRKRTELEKRAEFLRRLVAGYMPPPFVSPATPPGPRLDRGPAAPAMEKWLKDRWVVADLEFQRDELMEQLQEVAVSEEPAEETALDVTEAKPIDREDVVATSAVIFEDMRRTEDLEALVEPPADPKEKEDRGVEGRMSSADELKEARRGRGKKEYKAFARQLSIRAIPVAVFAKFLGVNTAVAARLIRYTATRVQVSEKAIARAVSASRSEESGSMTEKDRDIAEAAIGNAWKQFTAPIRTELQAFFSGILSEPGLEKLVKEATPGTQRRAVLELLLAAYGEVDIRSTAQAGRAHSAKGQAMDPVAYGEHHAEEDQGLGKIEKRAADTGPLLGMGIHRSSIQSIAAHFFTIATALGQNKDYKMFDKWRDKHLPSGQTGRELHWWTTWVRAANILDASSRELAVLSDLLFLTPGEKPHSPPTNGHTDGIHRQSFAAALGVNLQPQPYGPGDTQIFAGALVSDAEVGKVIEALIPVKDIRGLGPMGEFVLKYTPKLSELMIEGKTIATRRLVTEMLQEIASAAKSDTAIAKWLKDAGRVGEKEENVKNLLEAVTKASEDAAERDAATMAKVAKRREKGGKGVSAGVSDIVSQAAKSEAAQTSGWLKAVADSKDMRVFKPVFDHIALMAKLYGMKASLELRANNLQTVMRDRGEGEQLSPLTQAITIASSEAAEQYSAQEESLDHLILLVENMRYGEFAVELHSQHASSQEMRISPAKDKYLLAPWGIPRFSESHYTVLNRASMKGYSALGIRVGRGLHNIHGSATIQLVLDPAILGTVGPSPSSVTAIYEMLKSDRDTIDEKRREENLAKDKELNRKRKDAFNAAAKRLVEPLLKDLLDPTIFGVSYHEKGSSADFEEIGLWTPPHSRRAPQRIRPLSHYEKKENEESFKDYLSRYPSTSEDQRHDNDHTAFMALSEPSSTVSQNYEAAGGHLPSMWDASELPEIGESKTRTSIFLMAYDKWVRELEHLRSILDTNLMLCVNAVTDYVEGVEGLRGGARIARANQIRAALSLRMEMEYWAVSGGGRESQKRIHGWKEAKDERGLWRHFSNMKGSKLGSQHKAIFDLAMSIKEDAAFAPIAQVFDRMVEQQAFISDLAVRSKLIKRKISHHMHLAWSNKDAPNIEEWENIGERTGVGGAALHKKYSSVLEGWAHGLELSETDGLLAMKKNGMRVAEAAHNRAILFTMELAGIVKRIPPSGNLNEGHTKLEDKMFERHQAEKWVAKFMNNATSRLRVSDIKNPYARKYMHTTVMMKHNLLMLGFFHHQAFPRSYFFTVDHKTAWGGFMKLPWIAKAALMSYKYHAGFGTRKELDEAADRFPGYSAGRTAIESKSPLLVELRRAGLLIQVGEDVRATSSGGGYDIDEVAMMDKRMANAKKWLADKGVPAAFSNKVIDMLNGVRNFQRGTATWLFNSLGANLKAAQAIAHLEELLEKHKERLKTDYDGAFRLGLATQVANLSNDDFGGMNHMARGGRIDTLAKPSFLKTKIAMPRHARTAMLARALLLAPDWTESNLMTVLRSVWKDGKMAEDKEILEIGRKLHQHMWLRVVSRGLFLQILINAVMAGLDDERDIWDLYKEAGFPGYGDDLAPKWQKLRWLDINLSMLSPNDSRKFVSILGHFADPFHWTMDMFGERGGLMTPLMKKGSPGAKTVLSFIDGVDWAGRRFTTWDEFWGTDDDAGIYQRRTKQSDGTYKEAGESKAGRYQFQISRYGLDKGPVGADQMFTYTFEQLRRFFPIQTRTAMDYAMGTKDGFDFIGGMLGFKATRTWPD